MTPQPGTQTAPTTLELLIHGIKNTPPSEMLECEASELVKDRGDDLGGFWKERVPAGDPDIQREAYSWGALARSDGGALAGLGQVVVHIGWFLLLPFGLANVAYWMREIPPQDAPVKARRRPRGRAVPPEWAGGAGSSTLRLFAVGLTLLYVVVLATVSIELVGVQCYRAVGVCSALPEFFQTFAPLNRAERLAVFAAVPVLGILLLALLGWRARRRYEASIVSLELEQTHDAGTVRLLATPGFWRRARVAGGTERLHFAAAIAMLSAMLAWDHLMVPYTECRTPISAFPGDCLALDGGLVWTALSALPGTTAWFGASLALFVASVALVTPGAFDWMRRNRPRLSVWLLVATVVAAAGTIVVTTTDAADRSPVSSPFLGLVSTPVNLVGVLVVLCLAGLAIRRYSMGWVWLVAVLSVGVAGIRYLLPGPLVESPVFLVISSVLLAVQVAMAFLPRKSELRYIGWGGRGTGVVMLLALGIALTLASLLVVGVAAWLSPPQTAVATELAVPALYATFGVGLLGIVVIIALLISILAVRHLSATTLGSEDGLARQIRSKRRFASLAHRAEPVLGWLAALFAVALLASAAPELTAADGTLGVLAGPSSIVDLLVRVYPGRALAILGVVAAAIVAAIAANALTTKERPLGLLWDLLSFLPRAGHPFSPPCYAERVVPEVDARIRAWLQPEGVPDDITASRRVVLSAHSLGGMLAVASIFALRTQDPTLVNRIGLLTYGTQLRPYFGRFFPDLFGPAVLGTAPCPAPRPWATDAWSTEPSAWRRLASEVQAIRELRSRPVAESSRQRPTPSVDGIGADDLSAILSTTSTATPVPPPVRRPSAGPSSSPIAWISLYRATDFLGFPVSDPASTEGGVDLLASEEDTRTYLPTVATHSHYPLAPEYQLALRLVMDRIPLRTPPPTPATLPAATPPFSVIDAPAAAEAAEVPTASDPVGDSDHRREPSPAHSRQS